MNTAEVRAAEISRNHVWLACLLLLSSSACDAGRVESASANSHVTPTSSPAEPATPLAHPDCEPALLTYAQTIWGPIVSQDCAGCHTPGGFAKQQGARFILENPRTPGYLATNYKAMRQWGDYLLAKVRGEHDHMGGVRFAPGTPQYAALEQFMNTPEPAMVCGLEMDPKNLDSLALLPANALLRKATVQLGGRLPTPAERQLVQNGNVDALMQVLDRVMMERGFNEWLATAYNDVFLTNIYTAPQTILLSDTRFPNQTFYNRYPVGSDVRRAAEAGYAYGVGREALELIGHVVRLNRPFTEILTANYMMVNPYSAEGLIGEKHGLSFQDPNNQYEFQPAVVPGFLEHAGILGSYTILQRFPNTDSNRNRHRVKLLYDALLDNDILELAMRTPLNLAAAGVGRVQTMTNPQCMVCHRLLDPVGGLYQSHDNGGLATGLPVDLKPVDAFPPGFEGELLPDDAAAAPLQWLGNKMAQDPRFVRATVKRVYTALMGRPPVSEPPVTSSSYAADLSAYLQQQSILTAVGATFVADNYNFKTLVKELIKTSYYGAYGLRAGTSDQTQALLRDFGTARRRSPEDLDRLVTAVTGRHWRRGLLQGRNYQLLFGGIDSDTKTQRDLVSNAVINQAGMQLAYDAACESVPRDFGQDAVHRRLFPLIDPDATLSDPKLQAAIKQTIQYLHWALLGEELSVDDPEIENTYQVLLTAQNNGSQQVQSGMVDANIPYACQVLTYDGDGIGPAGLTGLPGTDLPPNYLVRADSNYSMRAWIDVVAYLMADFRFFYD